MWGFLQNPELQKWLLPKTINDLDDLGVPLFFESPMYEDWPTYVDCYKGSGGCGTNRVQVGDPHVKLNRC